MELRFRHLVVAAAAGAICCCCSVLLLEAGSIGIGGGTNGGKTAAAAGASQATSLFAVLAAAAAGLQQRAAAALSNPPQRLIDLFSFLPEPLQLRRLLPPEEHFPECLHTPDVHALLRDAQLLHPLLQQLKSRTFFRIFKLNIQQKTCQRDLLLLSDSQLQQQQQQQQQESTLLEPQSLFPGVSSSAAKRAAAATAAAGGPKAAAAGAAAAAAVADDDIAVCVAPEKCGLCTCSDEEVPIRWKNKPLENFVDRRHAVSLCLACLLSTASFYRWKESSLTPDAPFSSSSSSSSSSSGSTSSNVGKEAAAAAAAATAAAPVVYVDLMRNPPGYTEYQGGPIWGFLHRQLQQLQQSELQQQQQQQQKQQQQQQQQQEEEADVLTCGDAAKLSRVLSGMQSNISALAAEYFYAKPSVLSNGDSDEVPPPPKPSPSVSFFLERFAQHPERIQNLFFTFAFILKGVCGLTDVLQECSCETGNGGDDLAARAELLQILNATASQLTACNAAFRQPVFNANSRLSFLESAEDIDSLLRCVSCEKCQLHGTIKLIALRLAAKSAKAGSQLTHLERNEVTGTLNALYYFADSILAVQRMQLRISYHNLLLLAAAAGTAAAGAAAAAAGAGSAATAAAAAALLIKRSSRSSYRAGAPATAAAASNGYCSSSACYCSSSSSSSSNCSSSRSIHCSITSYCCTRSYQQQQQKQRQHQQRCKQQQQQQRHHVGSSSSSDVCSKIKRSCCCEL
ncbi:hypothetical protein ACSSS7_008128 [Eimeria intestinalis]